MDVLQSHSPISHYSTTTPLATHTPLATPLAPLLRGVTAFHERAARRARACTPPQSHGLSHYPKLYTTPPLTTTTAQNVHSSNSFCLWNHAWLPAAAGVDGVRRHHLLLHGAGGAAVMSPPSRRCCSRCYSRAAVISPPCGVVGVRGATQQPPPSAGTAAAAAAAERK